ncbi:CLAVATA3/ESR (CLE)-related protein 46-like [Melia azedarach]|uniref:CLAVATA3/ESR (CLE)-related protein 46-like n=1 Tax=Melia azedarach TaxID=155640 RepID=A0ACC1YPY9_MELAZ|nr:CLAVATA3/ESR (CLE)-related protein 46-like [Melia azedarach]
MRTLTLIYLLLAWLLVVASQRHFSTKVMVQAIESVELKVRPGQSGSRSRTGKVWVTWTEKKKIRKTPSGPNPVGNHHPPSRH